MSNYQWFQPLPAVSVENRYWTLLSTHILPRKLFSLLVCFEGWGSVSVKFANFQYFVARHISYLKNKAVASSLELVNAWKSQLDAFQLLPSTTTHKNYIQSSSYWQLNLSHTAGLEASRPHLSIIITQQHPKANANKKRPSKIERTNRGIVRSNINNFLKENMTKTPIRKQFPIIKQTQL